MCPLAVRSGEVRAQKERLEKRVWAGRREELVPALSRKKAGRQCTEVFPSLTLDNRSFLSQNSSQN